MRIDKIFKIIIKTATIIAGIIWLKKLQAEKVISACCDCVTISPQVNYIGFATSCSCRNFEIAS